MSKWLRRTEPLKARGSGVWWRGFLLGVLSSVPTAAEPEAFEFFEKHIRPVLVENCYECHSAQSKDVKGNLLLDSKGGMLEGGTSGKPVVIPGEAERSLIIQAITHAGEDLKMPPKGKKLSDEQIEHFVAWINSGAPDPRTGIPVTRQAAAAATHWAFQPPGEHPIPKVELAGWAQSPIDHFILAKLEAAGLKPSPRADKRTLIRRATFDLTGLPPTMEEVEAFLKDDSTEAFARVVDRLLNSPRYGERYARYWLDLARYADTKGYVYGGEETRTVHSHVYRDWVIQSLNEDLPYDQFLLQQIAADQLGERGKPTADHEVMAASNSALAGMGFLTLGRRFLGVQHDIIDDRIDVVTRGLLGLTVTCARCHDHKFDPIPTADYYSLYGVFAGSTESTVSLVEKPGRSEAFLAYEQEMEKRVRKLEETFQADREAMTDRLRRKVKEYLVAVLDARNLPGDEFVEILGPDDINPRVVRDWQNYIFRTRERFHPLFAPWNALIELPEGGFREAAQRVLEELSRRSDPAVNPRVLEALQAQPLASMRQVAEIYGQVLTEVDQKWRGVLQAATENKTNPPDTLADEANEAIRRILYGSSAITRVPPGSINDLEFFFDEPTWRKLKTLQAEIDRWIVQSPGAPPHSVILVDQPSPREPRIFLRGNPANKGDEVPRRFLSVLSGAEQQPFARGSGRLEMAQAIASEENPLTARVMVNRLWLYHFGQGLVSTPSDFGTRCEPPSHPELLDWLARRFIQEGWSIKQMHRLMMVSSTYQQSSLRPPEAGLAEKTDPENRLLGRMNRQRLDFEAMRDSLLTASGELNPQMGGLSVDLTSRPFSGRRSIYGLIDRQFLPGMLRAFDFANPDAHSPKRYATTVSPQALFFLNSPFVVERARVLTGRADVQALKNEEERVRLLYRLVYQREPTVEQLGNALQFVRNAVEEPRPEPPKPTQWQYGFGEFDEPTQRMKVFTPLPHFEGEAWQGGPQWPDAQLGWVRLTAEGGHAGNDLRHAAIRRWVSPLDGAISISGSIQHAHPQGDGIRARVISSAQGQLEKWEVHNSEASAAFDRVEVRKGDTIDFVVDYREGLNSDDFIWIPILKRVEEAGLSNATGEAEWNAKNEFGAPQPPKETPLNRWEKYAHVLLMANEFMFVD